MVQVELQPADRCPTDLTKYGPLRRDLQAGAVFWPRLEHLDHAQGDERPARLIDGLEESQQEMPSVFSLRSTEHRLKRGAVRISDPLRQDFRNPI